MDNMRGFFIKADVVVNSVREKKIPTEDVLTDAGKESLANRFSRFCGQELVDDLSSPAQPCWKNGELILTPAYDLDKGPGTPTYVIHFCQPEKRSGNHIYQVNMPKVRMILISVQILWYSLWSIYKSADTLINPARCFQISQTFDTYRTYCG